ncbi:MAG: O-antigen ligase family protein [Bacteroidales bacterium]
MRKLDFSNFFSKKIGIVLVLLAFFIPVNYRFTIYLIAILTVVWVLSLNWYYNYKDILKDRKNIVLIILWVLYAISLLYTKNISKGVADITQKLSLLILPLIFITSWNDIKKYNQTILNSYLFGLVLVSLFLLFRAIWFSYDFSDNTFKFIPIDTPWENYFFYFRFTHPYHPTYLSLYLCLGLAIVTNNFIEIKSVFHKVVFTLFYLLFLTIVYLSSSKAGLVVGAIVFITSIFWIIGRKSRIYAGVVSVIIAILVIIFMLNNSRVVYFIDYIRGNVDTTWSADQIAFQNKLKSEATVRIDIWRSIPNSIGNEWFLGVGIGDTKDVLVNGYKKNGVDYAANMELNAHNQYLEVFVGLGILGFVILLLILSIGYRTAFLERSMLLFNFIMIISVNMFFESIIERFLGVIFFSFFYCLLIMIVPKK